MPTAADAHEWAMVVQNGTNLEISFDGMEPSSAVFRDVIPMRDKRIICTTTNLITARYPRDDRT